MVYISPRPRVALQDSLAFIAHPPPDQWSPNFDEWVNEAEAIVRSHLELGQSKEALDLARVLWNFFVHLDMPRRTADSQLLVASASLAQAARPLPPQAKEELRKQAMVSLKDSSAIYRDFEEWASLASALALQAAVDLERDRPNAAISVGEEAQQLLQKLGDHSTELEAREFFRRAEADAVENLARSWLRRAQLMVANCTDQSAEEHTYQIYECDHRDDLKAKLKPENGEIGQRGYTTDVRYMVRNTDLRTKPYLEKASALAADLQQLGSDLGDPDVLKKSQDIAEAVQQESGSQVQQYFNSEKRWKPRH
eukprot:gnl/TRDRNA2_/TRDRNA2_43822_c0_seq1.p1 gnl/TRDRNA2_/TRDRNA2_43822_c0~~gnl/TRDRNA2_/TRDRNA2_43822_c0_seq1.p1  ORF type:complete len:310 (+),score=79.94 gnl/TRDRNA2_/TRDRNA2_43822_c0_seq1:50-979(+)